MNNERNFNRETHCLKFTSCFLVFSLAILIIFSSCTPSNSDNKEKPQSDKQQKSPLQREVKQQQAIKIVQKEILKGKWDDKLIYISQQPYKGGEKVKSFMHQYQVPEKFSLAWFAFIDDAPKANWEHPCRYVFIDTTSGEYEVIQAKSPPDEIKNLQKLSQKE